MASPTTAHRSAPPRVRRRRLLAILWLAGFWLVWPSPLPAEPVNLFRAFTAHIQQQITADKRTFVAAQTCTEWFYRQQRERRSAPKAEGIAFSDVSPEPLLSMAVQTSDCPSRYPGGLEAAREDFGRTQSALSLSLTFYQYALVGDRNDDGRYATTELKDVMESFGLVYDAERPASAYLTDLNRTFDSIHKTGGLESLMTSLGVLLDKGYRLTERDRAALDRVTQ